MLPTMKQPDMTRTLCLEQILLMLRWNIALQLVETLHLTCNVQSECFFSVSWHQVQLGFTFRSPFCADLWQFILGQIVKPKCGEIKMVKIALAFNHNDQRLVLNSQWIRTVSKNKKHECQATYSYAMAVAQLAEWSLSTPEDPGSNPAISIYF